MPARFRVVALVALAAAGCRGARGEPTDEVPDPTRQPEQAEITDADREAAHSWSYGEVTFEPKASYRIAARVLASERYYMGWTGDIVPIDLALGWGDVSDPSVDDVIDWYQGGRWYFFRIDAASVLSQAEVARSSANVHLVPANPNLERALLARGEDDIIELRGYLVDIHGPSGARWKTSLSRTDTGGGSCEVMYVIELLAEGEIYR